MIIVIGGVWLLYIEEGGRKMGGPLAETGRIGPTSGANDSSPAVVAIPEDTVPISEPETSTETTGPREAPQPSPAQKIELPEAPPAQPTPSPVPKPIDALDAEATKPGAAPPMVPAAPQHPLQAQVFSSLVWVKVAGEKRMPLGVVTDFGVCTIMPGRFEDVELTTIDGTRTFSGHVVARGPFPFCWIESEQLDLPRVRLAEALVVEPQAVLVVVKTNNMPELQPATLEDNRVLLSSRATVGQAPVFSADGTCIGLGFRSAPDKPMRMNVIRRK